MWFERRLQDPNFNSLTVNPRVFVLMSQSDAEPHRIVCKLMTSNLYRRGASQSGLDPRSMTIIHTEKAVYLWSGSELRPQNVEAYKSAAMHHLQLMAQHERAP